MMQVEDFQRRSKFLLCKCWQ